MGLLLNMWFNGFQFSRRLAQYYNLSEYLYPTCLQSWNRQVLESIKFPLRYPLYFTNLSLCLYLYTFISMPVSVQLNLIFVYRILYILNCLQHCCEGYSADTAQMNTWKGCYAYNIALLTTTFASASWYKRISCKYRWSSGSYTTYGDSDSSSMDNKPSMNSCNSAVTHWVLQILNAAPILCHVVTSNAGALMHIC